MNQISAKIVADSINQQGNRITTMEVIFPRFILAEFNTHRLFSRNSASSRAIPFKKMLRMVQETPFIPIAWQKDHSGMQGSEYFTKEMETIPFKTIRGNEFYANKPLDDINHKWLLARNKAVETAFELNSIGVTKQLCNRLLEPFMYHKVLVTFTESDNFFNLRCPRYETEYGTFFSWKDLCDAERDIEPTKSVNKYDYDDPILDKLSVNKGMGEIHIMDLAEKMWDAMNESTPKLLQPGEWHVPYGDLDENFVDVVGHLLSEGGNDDEAIEIQRIKIATARCARLSYQTLGDNPKIDYEADLRLFDTLFASGHLSPFEHCGRAMTDAEYHTHVKGVIRTDESLGWSNNFKGFVQYRQILES